MDAVGTNKIIKYEYWWEKQNVGLGWRSRKKATLSHWVLDFSHFDRIREIVEEGGITRSPKHKQINNNHWKVFITIELLHN